jgi:hypothetical protein
MTMSAEAAITRRINRIGPPEPVVEQPATGSKSKTLKVKSENQNQPNRGALAGYSSFLNF